MKYILFLLQPNDSIYLEPEKDSAQSYLESLQSIHHNLTACLVVSVLFNKTPSAPD